MNHDGNRERETFSHSIWLRAALHELIFAGLDNMWGETKEGWSGLGGFCLVEYSWDCHWYRPASLLWRVELTLALRTYSTLDDNHYHLRSTFHLSTKITLDPRPPKNIKTVTVDLVTHINGEWKQKLFSTREKIVAPQKIFCPFRFFAQFHSCLSSLL